MVMDSGGSNVEQLLASDVTGDGKLDLLAWEEGSVHVLINQGSGSFGAPISYQVPFGSGRMAVVDVNVDGQPDLVVVNGYVGLVYVFLNQGFGSYGTARSIDAGVDVASVSPADLDGDGWPDLVLGYANSTKDYVSLLLNQRNGSFGDALHYRTGSMNTSLLITPDVNEGGRSDVVAANAESGNVTVLISGCQQARP